MRDRIRILVYIYRNAYTASNDRESQRRTSHECTRRTSAPGYGNPLSAAGDNLPTVVASEWSKRNWILASRESTPCANSSTCTNDGRSGLMGNISLVHQVPIDLLGLKSKVETLHDLGDGYACMLHLRGPQLKTDAGPRIKGFHERL